MEATALRIRNRKIADRNIVGRTCERILYQLMIKRLRFCKLSFREKSGVEHLGKPRHGREGRRLSEREVSESTPVAIFRVIPRDSSTPLRSAQNDRAITVLLFGLTMSVIAQLHAD